MAELVQLAAVAAGLALLRFLYRLLTRPSISDIPGPEPTSFWLGTSAPSPLPFFSTREWCAGILIVAHRPPPRAVPGGIRRHRLQVAGGVWKHRARQGAVWGECSACSHTRAGRPSRARSAQSCLRSAHREKREEKLICALPGGHAVGLGPQGAPVHLSDVRVQLPEAT